jgi:hypothetical protein
MVMLIWPRLQILWLFLLIITIIIIQTAVSKKKNLKENNFSQKY